MLVVLQLSNDIYNYYVSKLLSLNGPISYGYTITCLHFVFV